MAIYKLYVMDLEGRIRSSVDIECDDDDEAIQAGELWAADGVAELWHLRRKVKTFRPASLIAEQ